MSIINLPQETTTENINATYFGRLKHNSFSRRFLGYRKVILIVSFLSITFVSCETANQVLQGVGQVYGNGGLTNTDIIAGLKQALQIGTQNGTNKLSAADGFLKMLQ